MSWGLGYSLLSLFRLDIKSQIEKHIMNIGIGLGVFPILSILLNTIRIPLTWYLFLLIAMLIPIKDAVCYFTGYSKIKPEEKTRQKKARIFKLTKLNLALIILFIIFFVHLSVYLKGAFIFPYLEDGDPWAHADVSQYIAETKSYSIPAADWKIFHYTEPYPPAFAVMNAMLYQINPDLKWILKFFNSFIISLGILFLYFFMLRLMKSPLKAVFAAFLLAVVPCYLSHFIFAASLAVTLFFPAFYVYSRINENRRWLFIAGIISASIFVTQPITAGVFGIIAGLYWIIGVVLYRNLQKDIFIAIVLSVGLSWIYYIPMLIKFGFNAFATKLGFYMFLGENKQVTQGVTYTFQDYFFSPIANKIDQATGFGPFFFIALILSLLLFLFLIKKLYKSLDKEKSRWIILSYIIFILTFIATESNHFKYTFFPTRIWVYMAVAAVIIVAFGTFSLLNSFSISKKARYCILGIFILGLVLTSGIPKYKVQTSNWPPDYGYFQLTQDDTRVYSPELAGYLWMEENVPWKSKAMELCWPSDQLAAGFNMDSQTADKEIRQFKSELDEKTANEIISFAKQKDYDYIIFGLSCIKQEIISLEKAQALLANLSVSEEVEAVYTDSGGMFVFRLDMPD